METDKLIAMLSRDAGPVAAGVVSRRYGLALAAGAAGALLLMVAFLGVRADIAQAALFLASPASAFMTGQILYVDGGFTAGWAWPIS